MSEEVKQNVATVENTAPAAAPAETGEPSPLESVDDIAGALLDQFGEGEEAKGDAEQPAEDAGAEEGEKADEKPAEEPVEAQNEQPEAEAVPMPEGADKAAWDALTPEARSFVHAREQEHARALGEARMQAQAIAQDRQMFAEAANAQINQALEAMKGITEADYAGIDWQALAQQDPATYVQLQQGYNQRMAQIQGITQQLQATARVWQERRAAERATQMRQEFQQAEPQIRALIGDGYSASQTRDDLIKYMRGQGVPDRVMKNLSHGYELTLVTKAMLYDRMQAARATARKKVAEAPVVQAPSGRQPAEDSRQSKAMSALKRNPHSTDALADAFAALG